ncbi:MAG: response regulator transcription factor, partial [Verrucomicrobiota bacterium]
MPMNTQSEAIRVVVVDDHPIFREGLAHILERADGFQLTRAVSSGTEAMDALKELSPEVMVLDVGLPDCNGVDLAKSILEAAPATKVVMLTMHDEPELFELAMDRGLSGYVLKEDAVSNLVNCLETVMAGKKFVSPSLAPLLVQRFEMRKRLERDRPGLESLSPAERRV